VNSVNFLVSEIQPLQLQNLGADEVWFVFFVWTYSHGYCDCFISTELQLQGFLHKLFWTLFSESLYLWNNHSIMDLSFQFITSKISLNFLSWWQAWWLRKNDIHVFFCEAGSKRWGLHLSCNHSNLVFFIIESQFDDTVIFIFIQIGFVWGMKHATKSPPVSFTRKFN